MGRVAPAPAFESCHTGSPKPPLHSKIKPLSGSTFGFSPLHKNDNGDGQESKAKRYLEKDEKKASDNKDENTESYNTGRWGGSEKRLFLEGLRRYGKGRWKQIGKVVKTRSLVQIKSHGQKVLKKLEAGEDIFAELDKETISIDNSSQDNENFESESILQQNKSFKEKFLPSYHSEDNESISATRPNASRFSFFLPTRAQTREPEHDSDYVKDAEDGLSCSRFAPPRKRKGRKKKPKAKVARIDLAMESAGSFMDESSDEGSEQSSDLQQDTAVAVHALSTLFLNNQPSNVHISMSDNSCSSVGNISDQEKVSSSRVEGAHILLSLMGRRSREPDVAVTSKEPETPQSSSSTQSWWTYSLRRRS